MHTNLTDDAICEMAWDQVAAGLALIAWSGLAAWKSDRLRFVESDVGAFESRKGQRRLHPVFGRLLSWTAFGVGTEYLVKGVCLLRGLPLSKSTNVVRVPNEFEDVSEWAKSVEAGDPSAQYTEISFGTLGTLPKDWATQVVGSSRAAGIAAAVKLLAKTFRNREAHRYVKNTRALHFYVVGKVFIPAINELITTIDQAGLKARQPAG